MKPEIILSLGSNQGSITLYGINLGHDWSFLLKWDKSQTEMVSDIQVYKRGLEEVLEVLDDHGWHSLIPRTVHPLFAKQLLVEIEKRIPSHHLRFSYWRRLVRRSLSLSQDRFGVLH
ncbi:hypothetical protein [Pseudoneobacillus sp. C159]